MALISLPYFLLMAWYFLGQMEVWPGWKHTSLGESPAESGVGSHLCALAMLSIMLFPIPILFFAAGVASCISGFRVAARRPIVLCWVIPVVLSLLFPVLFLVLEPWLSSLL
jgi:hypothetical protein